MTDPVRVTQFNVSRHREFRVYQVDTGLDIWHVCVVAPHDIEYLIGVVWWRKDIQRYRISILDELLNPAIDVKTGASQIIDRFHDWHGLASLK